MKRLIFFFTLLFNAVIPYESIAENKIIDSLSTVLKSQQEGIEKVKTLNALAFEFKYNNADTSLHFADKALKLSNRLNYKKGVADSYMAVAAAFLTLGKSQQALKNLDNSLKIYNNLELDNNNSKKESDQIKNDKSRLYNLMGTVYIRLQDKPAEALKCFSASLKINLAQENKRGIAVSYNNIGNVYFVLKKYKEALKNFSASLKIKKEMGNMLGIAESFVNIGNIYNDTKYYSLALANYDSAYVIYKEKGHVRGIAGFYQNRANVFANQKKYVDAFDNYSEALKISMKLKDQQEIAGTYINISDLYRRQKKYLLAKVYARKCLKTSENLQSFHLKKFSYFNIASSDSAIGNFNDAFKNYKLYIIFRDSLLFEENSKKMVETQLQYEFDQKELIANAEQEKKNLLIEKEIQKQKLLKNSFLSGFAFVLFFAVTFFIQKSKIKAGKKLSDELLLNILPSEIAEELKQNGNSVAKQFDDVTVIFTDFKDFSLIAQKMSPKELVEEIDTCYKAFDRIMEKNGIEKIKTIGDSYMAAGGLPVENKTNAISVVDAAMEILKFTKERLEENRKIGKQGFEIRLGINTGQVVAGIVGVKKFAYDIWGDTVNIASRMESSGEAGKVNISGTTYALVKEKYNCLYRGKIDAKNKGLIDMYFVESIA